MKVKVNAECCVQKMHDFFDSAEILLYSLDGLLLKRKVLCNTWVLHLNWAFSKLNDCSIYNMYTVELRDAYNIHYTG